MRRPRTPAKAIGFLAAGTAVFAARTAPADASAPPADPSRCPDEAAVWSSATALVPSAAGVLLAARSRVTISDLGDRYVVRVVTDHGPLERTSVDPGRECDKRTRFAAEFIVLALLPPTASAPEPPPPLPGAPDSTPPAPATSASPAPSVPAAPPAPRPPAPPPPAPASAARLSAVASRQTGPETPSRAFAFRVELGFTAQGAPALLGAFPTADAGGEARIRLGAGPWTVMASAAAMPKVTFTARGDRVGLWRVPLEAGVRAQLGTAWAAFAADAALSLAYEQYTGESTHAPQWASRWAPGVAVGAIASAPPLAGFAPYLRLSCALFPFAQSLVFLPDTNPPKTPSLWLGASVGLSYAH